MKLYLDTETYSETPIKNGTYRYVQDCELMIITWAIDEGEVYVLDMTARDPEDAPLYANLISCLDAADQVIAHNAMFDRLVVSKHVKELPIAKWRCTMVKALAHSLPGSLDILCGLFKIAQDKAKHKAGKELVRLFCMPRPKNSKLRRATRATHPQEWQRFIEYAKSDIEAMRAVDKKLPEWNYHGEELALWHLDQRINDRGFAVDLDLANAAINATVKEQDVLAGQANEMTSGEVSSATKRDALLEHILTEYAIALPDLQGATIERRLNDPDIPQELKELLKVRLQAATTSTSKYRAVVKGATDGRLRGTLQFDGASRTGRWAGRTFQPQNLPRPMFEADEIEFGIEVLKADVADLVYLNVMQLISSAIRGCIVAPAGSKLVVSDLSNIEGRVLAWLAGEEWKIEAFRDFDNGSGADLYKLAYAKAFNIDADDVSKKQRQIGKVKELMLGYEGGVGAYITGAATYGIDLDEMAMGALGTLPDDVYGEADRFYEWTVKNKRNTFGLSRETFIVCDAFKRLWRYSNPNIASLWKELESACVQAVENPGTVLSCRKMNVRRDGSWLRVILPSGRALCYPHPRVEEGKLSYMGMNQYSRQWQRLKTYGGKLVENACQAVARDVIAHNMNEMEWRGYKVVLTVHDEVLTETPDKPDFNVYELSNLLATNPIWARGLPLAAAGFEGYRYRKD